MRNRGIAVATGIAGGFALGFVTPPPARLAVTIGLLFANAVLLALNTVQHKRFRRALKDAEDRLQDAMPALLAAAAIEMQRHGKDDAWLN